MAKFIKKRGKGSPGINTASLPDIVFMLLFFFMVVTKLRDAELKGAYNELWDDMSRRKYGVAYSEDLPVAWKKAIKDEIPMVLSEAEPTAFGKEN